MKKNIKYVVIGLIIILIIVIGLLVYLNAQTQKNDNENVLAGTQVATPTTNNTQENAIVIEVENKVATNETQQQPEPQPQPEPEKDAATLTQEIYDRNASIGTLYIPKTKLTTEIYSNPDVDKMEKMPCFLYTSGGLSKKGVTLFIGHNKRNGKLFSNNKKLEEGDEFYFTDYEGKEIKYTIYSKFITTDDDVSFLSQEVDVPTIALSCCTDANNENRIIILGRAN